MLKILLGAECDDIVGRSALRWKFFSVQFMFHRMWFRYVEVVAIHGSELLNREMFQDFKELMLETQMQESKKNAASKGKEK
jgi:hypothetical protein